MKLQSAVKKETAFVAAGTAVLSALMILAFFGLHAAMPEKVSAGLPAVLGGILGCAVAVANFFMMAVTVQKVASIEDYNNAYRTMQISYRYRTFLQLIWCVLAMVLRFINPVAGILPLLFPSLLIKARGILTGTQPAAQPSADPEEEPEENAGKEVYE